MPTVAGSGSQEVESQDEVKVFKYEGEEEEDEKSSSESLLKEDKSSLITETEEVGQQPARIHHVGMSALYSSSLKNNVFNKFYLNILTKIFFFYFIHIIGLINILNLVII